MKVLIRNIMRLIGLFASLPARFYSHEISEPDNVYHGMWETHLSREFNKPGMRILEIGSRVVTGANLRHLFDEAEYVGFDFHEGKNVDVVGDAHKLSSYFSDEEKFDLTFSSAVFEHLHMPWIVAEEIDKVLKVGGYVFVETHFSFSSHERPWHFFQFSDMGLRALFSEAMGYQLIESGLSNPMVGFFGHSASRYLRYRLVRELYCHSEILVRKVSHRENFNWRTVDIDGIVEGTRYPLNN